MSVQWCELCEEKIDLDFDVLHFIEQHRDKEQELVALSYDLLKTAKYICQLMESDTKQEIAHFKDTALYMMVDRMVKDEDYLWSTIMKGIE